MSLGIIFRENYILAFKLTKIFRKFGYILQFLAVYINRQQTSTRRNKCAPKIDKRK